MDRRTFLSAAALVSLTGAAGCLGSSEEDPESRVETYFVAVDENDVETVNEVVHDEALTEYDVDDLTSIGSVEIIEIEQRPIDEIVPQLDQYEDTVEDIIDFEEHERERLEEEFGLSEFAYVYFQVMPGDGPIEEEYFLLVKDDEWYIWT